MVVCRAILTNTKSIVTYTQSLNSIILRRSNALKMETIKPSHSHFSELECDHQDLGLEYIEYDTNRLLVLRAQEDSKWSTERITHNKKSYSKSLFTITLNIR